MDKELIKLIEENGLTLHGDIEFFAHLVAEREREACAKLVFNSPPSDEYEPPLLAVYNAIRARGEK
jgi:hypothetical protein